jgi:hypothetical protein
MCSKNKRIAAGHYFAMAGLHQHKQQLISCWVKSSGNFMRYSHLPSACLIVAASTFVLSAPAAAVTINPIFAPTYTGPDYGLGSIVSLENNAAAQASIDAAAGQISGLFTNNVTVNILYYGVHGGADGFIGANVAGQPGYSYDQYTAALAADAAAHPGNIDLATAVAHLGSGNGAGDPLAFVVPTTVGARVLNLPYADPQFDTTGDFVDSGGTVDGVVFLNLDESLSYTRPISGVASPVVYDVESAMEHETDEVFGVGGHGSTLNDLVQDPNYAFDASGISGATLYGADDLYRYSNGLPSYTVNPNVDFSQTAYFSIDGGVTAVEFYNQEAMVVGDAADWAPDRICPGGGVGGDGFVQDAFGCGNESPDVTYGSPEFVEFEAIGFSTPEPAAWMLMIVGFSSVGWMTRRQTNPFELMGAAHAHRIGRSSPRPSAGSGAAT